MVLVPQRLCGRPPLRAATGWPTHRSALQAPQLSPRTAPRYARSTHARGEIWVGSRGPGIPPPCREPQAAWLRDRSSWRYSLCSLSERRNLMIVQLFSNAWSMWTAATRPAISSPSQGRGSQVSEVFDDIIDRETDVARIAVV